ncbi:MAG: phosphate/phosphite/phosphonate ABC transporter substrate-binding protein [Opitutales bacterium]
MNTNLFKMIRSLATWMMLAVISAGMAFGQSAPLGSQDNPIKVMLVPTDGGTDAGTRADFEPVFNAVGRATDLHFDIRVGQSYGAVIEGLINDLVHVAFVGPVSYLQAKERDSAELLAVSVTNNASVYYAGIFTHADSPIKSLKDLKGKRVAFGDTSSTSSFTYQVAMMVREDIDPVRDLAEARLTGSHVNSLMALNEGLVDAACLSFDSFEKAINNGNVDAGKFRVLVRSDPIPNPPIVMNPRLNPEIKDKLRKAFGSVHQQPGINPEMIRGYGGKRVDRYDTEFTEEQFSVAAQALALVTDEIKREMVRKAASR